MLIRRFIRNTTRFTAAGLMFSKIYRQFHYQKQIQNINLQMMEHNNHLADGDAFLIYFNDARLQNLVQSNYYLSDLVRIANSLVYHTKKEDFTDIKVLFLVYTSNLFYTEIKGAANSIFLIIINVLQQKINTQNFIFQSPEIQRALLLNINYLTRRNNNYLIKQRSNLELQLFYFVCLKYKIMSKPGVYCEVNGQSLQNLISALPYLSKDSSGISFLDEFEQYFIRVAKLQIERLFQKQGLLQSDDLKVFISRYILIMQSAISIHKLKGKFIKICQMLPIQFSYEAAFINYLRTIQYFMTQNLIKAIDIGHLKQYHFLLADKNKMYRSVAAVKAMEDYVEHLILAKYRDHIQVFSPFFDQNPFIYDQTKWKGKSYTSRQSSKLESTEQE